MPVGQLFQRPSDRRQEATRLHTRHRPRLASRHPGLARAPKSNRSHRLHIIPNGSMPGKELPGTRSMLPSDSALSRIAPNPCHDQRRLFNVARGPVACRRDLRWDVPPVIYEVYEHESDRAVRSVRKARARIFGLACAKTKVLVGHEPLARAALAAWWKANWPDGSGRVSGPCWTRRPEPRFDLIPCPTAG